VEAVLRLTRRRAPGRVALPGGLEARAAYGELRLGPAPAATGPLPPRPILAPGTYQVLERGLTLEIALGAGSPPAFPLELRSRRPGDRFRPERGRGSKKLKAWLIDRKVPRERRDALLVLADAAGRIVAVPELGVRGAGAGALSATVRAWTPERSPGLQPAAPPAIRKDTDEAPARSPPPGGMSSASPAVDCELAPHRKG
jgi:tRNA(Ile)-lysidine synthase